MATEKKVSVASWRQPKKVNFGPCWVLLYNVRKQFSHSEYLKMRVDFPREKWQVTSQYFCFFFKLRVFALQIHNVHLYNNFVIKKHTFQITYVPTKEWPKHKRSKKAVAI